MAEIRVHWKGPYVREQEIDPELYCREGNHLLLQTEWPVEGDLVVPLDQAPTEMTDGMSAEWRLKKEPRGTWQKLAQAPVTNTPTRPELWPSVSVASFLARIWPGDVLLLGIMGENG